MPSAVINVVEMAMPAPGKKRGRIKDRDGTIYQIDPPLMAGVKNGDTCEVSFYDDEWKGMKFRVIETLKNMMIGSVAPATPPSILAATHASVVPTINRDELIFVEALIKEWVAKIPIGDAPGIIHAVNALRMAFHETFGKNPQWRPKAKVETSAQRMGDDMNDEIPGFE